MNEDLLAEIAAMGRLIGRLDVEIERLKRQFDTVEKTAAEGKRRRWRGRDDEDDGSD